MTFKDLDEKLKELKIQKKFYVTRELKAYYNDILIVDERDKVWIISYFERGSDRKIACFKYEHEAVSFVYGSILSELEQYYKAKIKIEL